MFTVENKNTVRYVYSIKEVYMKSRSSCPYCRRIRAILVWGALMALMYFSFYI